MHKSDHDWMKKMGGAPGNNTIPRSMYMGMHPGTNTIAWTSRDVPKVVHTEIWSDCIEVYFKQSSIASVNGEPLPDRVYKIVYGCKDGKFHASEPIEGAVLPATGERYLFEEEK